MNELLGSPHCKYSRLNIMCTILFNLDKAMLFQLGKYIYLKNQTLKKFHTNQVLYNIEKKYITTVYYYDIIHFLFF